MWDINVIKFWLEDSEGWRAGLTGLCNDAQLSSVFVELSQTNYQARTELQLTPLSTTIDSQWRGVVGVGAAHILYLSKNWQHHIQVILSYCFCFSQPEQSLAWCRDQTNKGENIINYWGDQEMSSLVFVATTLTGLLDEYYWEDCLYSTWHFPLTG